MHDNHKGFDKYGFRNVWERLKNPAKTYNLTHHQTREILASYQNMEGLDMMD